MKNKTKLLEMLIILTVFGAQAINIFAQNKEYNILSYGAIADGITNNAGAIQKAIDEASVNGGGKVIVPPEISCQVPYS